jgi:hypothetical protein
MSLLSSVYQLLPEAISVKFTIWERVLGPTPEPLFAQSSARVVSTGTWHAERLSFTGGTPS